ncbi:endonuclease domain-containing protein [Phenylobacterium terrae]|uniref:endonuclease domain-containing protein n=1 Tax=Phenylobacterium terrae TaxID=2665495 RepID=UPI003623B56D
MEGAGRLRARTRRDLITNRARAMRRAMTEPEVMLWSRLRGRCPDKPTFRRQHPFGSMVFDFYCPAARLAVEVDGATHWEDEAQAKDEARDRWLAGQGVEVMRIPASAIYRNLAAVVDAILQRVDELIAAERRRMWPAPSTPRSPLRSAGGPPPAASRGR